MHGVEGAIPGREWAQIEPQRIDVLPGGARIFRRLGYREPEFGVFQEKGCERKESLTKSCRTSSSFLEESSGPDANTNNTNRILDEQRRKEEDVQRKAISERDFEVGKVYADCKAKSTDDIWREMKKHAISVVTKWEAHN